MAVEDAGPDTREAFEISPRFRQLIEETIERLERDADGDEAQLAVLHHPDHIRRHMRLISAQRAQAMRMRNFLDRGGAGVPPPLISH